MNEIILLVEDDPYIQDLMDSVLAPLDVTLYHAGDGMAGVRMYKHLAEQSKRPDLVIMDVKMPVVDGVEATKQILELDPDATIYGFTAFASLLSREMREAGAKRVYPRTIGFTAMRKIIDASLPDNKKIQAVESSLYIERRPDVATGGDNDYITPGCCCGDA